MGQPKLADPGYYSLFDGSADMGLGFALRVFWECIGMPTGPGTFSRKVPVQMAQFQSPRWIECTVVPGFFLESVLGPAQ